MKKIIISVVIFITLQLCCLGLTFIFDYIKGGNDAREIIIVLLGLFSFAGSIILPMYIIRKDFIVK